MIRGRALLPVAGLLLVGLHTFPAAAQTAQPQQVVPCIPILPADPYKTGCIPISTSNPLPVVVITQTPLTAAGAGTTADVTAQISATAPQVPHLCVFTVSTTQGPTPATTLITVGPFAGNQTLTYQHDWPPNQTTTFTQTYQPCVAGIAGTPITVTAQANAGATAVAVNVSGYAQ